MNRYSHRITLSKLLAMVPLLFLWSTGQAQHQVSGTVVDASNQDPLPGVNIMIQGTDQGTSSNIDGEFSISTPDDQSTLVFTYIGYERLEVPLDGRSELEVELDPSVVSGDDIVVIGYGQQREESVTGSVSSISGDMVQEMPSSNISEALQGRVSGVDISRTSTQPGAAMQMRIRGTRSLSASNDPLVVLNGIPFSGSINDINTENIESVDILKDASATAIYGSRGANGVILISTKTGEEGQSPTITYNGYQGVQTVFAKYPMMNGPEFERLREEAGEYTNGADESSGINTDWQDLLYRTGAVASHNIGVSGGTEQGTYNVGLGFDQDKGIIPTQQYQRISLRGSITQQVGDYFSFGLNTNNNFNLTEGSQVGLYGILSMSPIASPYNEDGSWRRTISMPLDEQWVYSEEILERIDERWVDENRAYATYNSVFGELEIPQIEGLSYRVNLGLDYRQNKGGSFTGQGINSPNEETESAASVSNSHTYNWLIENIVSYDKVFDDVHEVNFTGLYSAEQNRFTRSSMSARDIIGEHLQYYNLGRASGEVTINPDGQVFEESGLQSWMGRAMYSYDNLYMLTVTLRTDGSSRLAEGEKWHTYPAVSAGWNIGNEEFMSDISFLNRLKLRVGYGQTSNQAITPYSTLGSLATRPYNFGDDTYSTGFYVSELPNPNLGWEFSETWNYGVDFSLLNGRLMGTMEYYVTNTEDILLNVNLPNTSGVSSFTDNIGETQNKGLELSLDGVILDNQNGWSWEAGVNFYGNRNKLVSLASGQERDESNWWFVGSPINVIYDYEKVGLWQEDDEHMDILEPGGNAGMIKVEYTGEYDENGEPVRAIGPEDQQVIDLQPKFQGGFSTRLAYQNLDLNIVGAFQNGGKLISTLHSSTGYLNLMSGRRNNVDVDYWTPENTDAKYPAPGGVTSGDNPKYGSTLGYFDASYLKIRTMTLGYNFDQSSWLQTAGISRLRLYATVQNPFVLFSPYNDETGLDPETNSFGDENAATTETYPSRLLTIGTNSPSTRNYMVGINLSF